MSKTFYGSACALRLLDVAASVNSLLGDVCLRRVGAYPSAFCVGVSLDALGGEYSLVGITDDERIGAVESSLYVVVRNIEGLEVGAAVALHSPSELGTANRDVVSGDAVGIRPCNSVAFLSEGYALGVGCPVTNRIVVLRSVVLSTEFDSAVARYGRVACVEFGRYVVGGNGYLSIVVASTRLSTTEDSPCELNGVVEVDVSNLNGGGILYAVHEGSLAGGGPLAVYAVARSHSNEANLIGGSVAVCEVADGNLCLARLLVDDVDGSLIVRTFLCGVLNSPCNSVVARLQVAYSGGLVVV